MHKIGKNNFPCGDYILCKEIDNRQIKYIKYQKVITAMLKSKAEKEEGIKCWGGKCTCCFKQDIQ